jgi:hypothetical protein
VGFYDALARRGAAKLANVANLEPGPAKDSQDSQDSQGVQPAAIAEVEAELARTARAAGLPFDRLRADPDGIRDVDIEWFARNWRTDCGRPLARAYLEAVAFRLAVDPLPIVAPAPTSYEKRIDR